MFLLALIIHYLREKGKTYSSKKSIIHSYKSNHGTLTLFYVQIISKKETKKHTKEELMGKYVLSLKCTDGNEIMGTSYDCLVDASKDFYTVLKTLKENPSD